MCLLLFLLDSVKLPSPRPEQDVRVVLTRPCQHLVEPETDSFANLYAMTSWVLICVSLIVRRLTPMVLAFAGDNRRQSPSLGPCVASSIRVAFAPWAFVLRDQLGPFYGVWCVLVRLAQDSFPLV